MLNIGIDTLFEHPDTPSSAIDYLVNAVRWLPEIAPQHRFTVFVSTRNRFRFDHLSRDNVRFVNCYVSNESIWRRIAIQQTLLPWKASEARVNILFSPGNVVPMWGEFYRVLKINTLHHYQTPEAIGTLRAVYRKIAFEKSAAKANCILANSTATKQEIVRFMRVDPDKVRVVWEASFDHYGPASQQDVRRVRERYSLPQEYLLFLSTLYPYKNASGLMHAYASLLHGGRVLPSLLIVGRDHNGQSAALAKLAEELQIEEHVQFLGFVEGKDIPALFSGAHVFVYPSLAETFGKPLVEAMQCGAPILASNIPAISEVMGDAGLLFNPQDPSDIAAGIARLAGNQELRAELVRRGLERSRRFTWHSAARATIGIIEQTHHHRDIAAGLRASESPAADRSASEVTSPQESEGNCPQSLDTRGTA